MAELLFNQYEAQFLSQCALVRGALGAVGQTERDCSAKDVADPRLIYSDVRKVLSEAELSLKYLETEMFGFPPTQRKPLQQRVPLIF